VGGWKQSRQEPPLAGEKSGQDGPITEGGTSVARTRVTIFGQSYFLKGEDDEEHLLRLAEVVDARMREMADRRSGIGTHGAAVLAALTLADDYLKLQEQYGKVMVLLEQEYQRQAEEDGRVIPLKNRGTPDQGAY